MATEITRNDAFGYLFIRFVKANSHLHSHDNDNGEVNDMDQRHVTEFGHKICHNLWQEIEVSQV